MVASVIFESQLEIPLSLQSFSAFRQWIRSSEFPERGRIDFVAGCIEVEMSPEEIFSHGSLKVELIRVISQITKDRNSGRLFTDSTRVSCPAVDLSVEPDIVFVSREALSRGRVQLVPKSGGQPGRFMELEGPPDLVVEIVSDSSVTKDTQRLPVAYYQAGIREFWLVDARGEELVFQIYKRGNVAYEPTAPDKEGYQTSAVFSLRFRLQQHNDELGHSQFDLCTRPS